VRGSVVIVRARNTGRILTLRRGLGASWCPGCWALPGGEPRFFEAPAQAARRELLEETGLRVGVLHPLGPAGGRPRRGRAIPEHFGWYFYAELPTEAPVRYLDGEHTDHLWVGPSEPWPRPSVVGLPGIVRRFLLRVP
jgi:8-oxo-dGTP pyrophosphatase MutT (NUDIX family)